MATKTTWAQRVLAVLNLSEEGKVGLFENYAIKTYEKGIKQRKDAIARLKSELKEYLEREEEVLGELKVEVDTTAVTVLLNQIGSVADRERYFSIFDANISEALQRVDTQEESISGYKDHVERKIKSLESEIEIITKKMNLLK